MTSPGRSFAVKPTLLGERVLLRPVAVMDAPELVELLKDPEPRRLTGTHRRVPAESERERAEQWYVSCAEHNDRLDLAVVERSAGGYVGEAILNQLDTDNRSCSFRIAIRSRVFGRGFGTEATRLVLKYAFEQVGIHRIDLEVLAFNPRARHVYERVGFLYEGTKRQALRWDGEWVDAHIMAVLVDDWASHRGYPRPVPH